MLNTFWPIGKQYYCIINHIVLINTIHNCNLCFNRNLVHMQLPNLIASRILTELYLKLSCRYKCWKKINYQLNITVTITTVDKSELVLLFIPYEKYKSVTYSTLQMVYWYRISSFIKSNNLVTLLIKEKRCHYLLIIFMIINSLTRY